ncbi:MAG TPA: hypothetical protein VI300_29020 [Solirubrobacter sp.]
MLGPAVAPPQRRRGAGRRRPVALLATAAFVVAIAIVVASGALPSGEGPQIAHRIAPPVAEAAPLVKLAKRIQQQPAPTGDATLVFRTHHFPEAKGFTGADLYLDDGRYYFGATLAELKAVKATDDIGEGVPKREHDAAVAANDLDPQAARKAMIDATWAGGHAPTAAENQAASARNLKILKLKRPKGPVPTPASPLTIDNNRIWMGGMDMLISGAGDAKVRAGVMKLFSTIEAVKVTDRGETLEITDTDFPDGYQETLVVDAQTGVIQKMIGGVAGKTPDVTVTYDIKRVDAKDYIS